MVNHARKSAARATVRPRAVKVLLSTFWRYTIILASFLCRMLYRTPNQKSLLYAGLALCCVGYAIKVFYLQSRRTLPIG